MLSKALIFMLVFVTSGEISRSGAAAQRDFSALVAPLRRCVRLLPVQSEDLAVEVFQAVDLPLTVHEAALTKTDKGLFLKLALGNSLDLKMIGLRYSLVTINSKNELHFIANRVEGFSLPAYASKTVTFKTPLKFKAKDGERLAVMVEQVVSRETIWEVIKAKEAFEAYARGDYSVVPVVLRVANQVDSPPGQLRMFY
ncbi:MAG TPA: hypothetical protein VJ306_23170 [Pyrinomonadaceae bacterium]|jgi:hypothetical protein|nr:hypothetical protein [Pyrinomonadaceae bacterium]